jgi:hypothetical protein
MMAIKYVSMGKMVVRMETDQEQTDTNKNKLCGP